MFHYAAVIWDIMFCINILLSMLLLTSLKHYIGNKVIKINK